MPHADCHCFSFDHRRSWVLAVRGGGLCRRLAGGGLSSTAHSARPWVYWFPLDGNITSNGITADLEAMKRVGIGGVLYMETEQGTPRGPAKFAGPLWRNLFKHLVAEASRLGIQLNVNNDAGWCGSGGPWITPELSMQRIVWTETNVTGPRHFEAELAQPTAVRNYYQDIAVFAFPTPASDYSIAKRAGKSGGGHPGDRVARPTSRHCQPIRPLPGNRVQMLTGESPPETAG